VVKAATFAVDNPVKNEAMVNPPATTLLSRKVTAKTTTEPERPRSELGKHPLQQYPKRPTIEFLKVI
jgi:hypothetical protein